MNNLSIEIGLAKVCGEQEKMYNKLVSIFIRKKYSQNRIEAILNNYISEPDNEKYRAEFLELQAYRAECKKQAKLEVYGEE